jgi:acyl dehydratase
MKKELNFDDVQVGDEIWGAARTVTEDHVVNFARLSGDYHPEHLNEEYARKSVHGERIAHGVLILGMATGQINETGLFENSTVAVLEMKVRFVKAVKFGDTVRSVARIHDKRITKSPDRGVVTLAVKVLNQRDETVVETEWAVLVRRVNNHAAKP